MKIRTIQGVIKAFPSEFSKGKRLLTWTFLQRWSPLSWCPFWSKGEFIQHWTTHSRGLCEVWRVSGRQLLHQMLTQISHSEKRTDFEKCPIRQHQEYDVYNGVTCILQYSKSFQMDGVCVIFATAFLLSTKIPLTFIE